MALACGQKPDHSTIAAFVSSIDNEIDRLFTKVLLICEEEGLPGGTHFSLDGIKLSSNAAKEWSGTFSDFKKKLRSIESESKGGNVFASGIFALQMLTVTDVRWTSARKI